MTGLDLIGAAAVLIATFCACLTCYAIGWRGGYRAGVRIYRPDYRTGEWL